MNNSTDKNTVWEKTGTKRRLVLLVLVVGPTIFAAQIMYSILPGQGHVLLNLLMTLLFGVLFGWISVGFWSSLAGAIVMLRGGDRFAVLNELPDDYRPPESFKTAMLFPVYNEDAGKVAEGIRTVRIALEKNGLSDHFDIFILSDSTNSSVWVTEEEAWLRTTKEDRLPGNLFYRHRQSNIKRKSGNVADFCRRWGKKYKYMIVFDADSLMATRTMVKMVQAMEAHPDIGILQTPPKAIFSRTILSKVQEFAGYLYGPVFAAGLHYWQLGDAQYWGHNAILRIKPFMEHCQLPVIPGKSSLSGEILSHDFVESALMRRAGYGVWLAYDLDGSWEQNPPSLIDELTRDRRWCQGNLQHSRLIFTKGFFPTHRALFVNGIMSYGSALLWFAFLVVSSVEALSSILSTPIYFPEGPSLFPDWPQYFPTWALTLLSSTAGLLFLPKIIAGLLVGLRGGAEAFGGVWRMILSILLEVIVSTFLAPVRMLFHSLFVITTLLGMRVSWTTQNRDDDFGLSWKAAAKYHWFGSVLGLIWGGSMYLVSPGFFIWFSPVAAGLALSIPLSVLTSRVKLGLLATRLGLLLNPSLTKMPEDVRILSENLARPEPESFVNIPRSNGFVRAVVIPEVLAVHRHISARKRKLHPRTIAKLDKLKAKALEFGPDALDQKEKKAILNDEKTLCDLHWAVWMLPQDKAELWGL